MSGYIKLHRQMMSHPKYKDSHHVHLWVHILMKAAFSPVDVDWKGKTVRLEPGQFTAGRKQLSDETGISEQRIKTALRRFISDSQINQQTSNKCSMFTVLNWEKYQSSNQPSTSNQPAINQPSTTKEEVEERKEIYTADKSTSIVPPKKPKKTRQLFQYPEWFSPVWNDIKRLDPLGRSGKRKTFDIISLLKANGVDPVFCVKFYRWKCEAASEEQYIGAFEAWMKPDDIMDEWQAAQAKKTTADGMLP